MYFVPENMFGGPQLVFSTGWTDASKSTIGALDVLCSRELVWVDQWTSSAPVEPMPLPSMHRCNDTSLDTVSETPTATNWTQRDQLNRRIHFLTRRFFRWSRFFCSGLPTAMWLSPLYIRAPPGSFKLPLTHWIPEATLEKKRECIEQKSDDLELDSVQHLKNSTFASVASVLDLELTECRLSEGLGACYSWCLTAPRRSWWSEGSWWALGVCGSPKKRSLYTVWNSPFRRWRRSILSDHFLLGEARERYPCVGAPTWIRGSVNSSIPREKIRLSRVLCIYFKQLNSYVLALALVCL